MSVSVDGLSTLVASALRVITNAAYSFIRFTGYGLHDSDAGLAVISLPNHSGVWNRNTNLIITTGYSETRNYFTLQHSLWTSSAGAVTAYYAIFLSDVGTCTSFTTGELCNWSSGTPTSLSWTLNPTHSGAKAQLVSSGHFYGSSGGAPYQMPVSQADISALVSTIATSPAYDLFIVTIAATTAGTNLYLSYNLQFSKV